MPRSQAVAAGITLLVALAFVDDAAAEIIYRPLGHEQVAATWTTNDDDTFAVTPARQMVDVNDDRSFEFEVGHFFRRPVTYVPRTAADIAELAYRGLADIEHHLSQMRGFAIAGVNQGVHDVDLFEESQRGIDAHSDAIDRIAHNLSYGGAPLLDGSQGYRGVVANDVAQAITVNRATADTVLGTYVVDVTTPALRAVVTSEVAQVASLVQDEVLTVNGVNVPLFAGMTQFDIVDQVNQYAQLTGVNAGSRRDGFLALYSRAFGVEGAVEVISNMPPAINTSGFGNVTHTAAGTDAMISVNGMDYAGRGLTTSVTGGDAKGLTITLGVDPSDITSSVAISDARVTVRDDSATFGLLPEDAATQVKLSLPNTTTPSLGLNVVGNLFNSLAEVRLSNARSATDALAVIDQATADVRDYRQHVGLFLRTHHLPIGLAELLPLESSEFAVEDGRLAVVHEGDLIGPDAEFTTQLQTYDAGLIDTGLDEQQASRFFGFRFDVDGALHYGWLRIGFDADNEMTLLDLAYENRPGRPIRVGLVPEPVFAWWWLVGAMMLARCTRRFAE